MSVVLHNLIAIAMSLLVLAAPALCMCTEPVAAREQQEAHQCCAQKQEQQPERDQHHSETCTHCGAQVIQALMDHQTTPADMPAVLSPVILDLQLQHYAIAPVTHLDHGQLSNPVRTHTRSLT